MPLFLYDVTNLQKFQLRSLKGNQIFFTINIFFWLKLNFCYNKDY